ncbi:putative immediate-early protein [Chinese giant salamander iridovirus]|uniref:Putative immediate-early protein n=1 Tax=Chinese giant salamander iridovirus TaxID=1213990 RepID=A0A088B1C0_FRG3V|nr:putative immediate-early protein [Chinese giant salamander iridovirus]
MSMIQAYLCDSVSGEPYTCKGDLCEIPFGRNFTRRVESLDDFKAEDFSLEGYDPHPAIRMRMAV